VYALYYLITFVYVSGSDADISENVVVLGTFVGDDMGYSSCPYYENIFHVIWILSCKW
jgi:hypothetical protein